MTAAGTGQERPGAEFARHLAEWDGAGVVVSFDRPTGTWIFVALHDDTLGRPLGGCRMKVYDDPADGLLDAQRLAEGMTSKWAAMDLPFGGGKSVLAIPRPLQDAERRGLLRRFGRLIDSLHGAYSAGADLGTTPQDMALLAEVTPWVKGVAPDREDGPTDPGPFTALGVLEGMKAALEAATGSGSLEDRTVLVQGVGDVGEPLARMVAKAGGQLLLSDLVEERARTLAEELGGEVVVGDRVYDAECDVYAPCAVGQTLNASTIPRLRCLVVAGSANNQLEAADDAKRLHHRDILYAPDYVVNGGGAMAFGLMDVGVRDPDELRRRVAGIGASLAEIFREARDLGESPVAAARRRVDRILERGPA
ncbi:MAG TPA: Glu/Leu/Phe/Val dehydrogenase dimerization domain-containing protein [Longimicrobiales bacterium]